MKKARYVKAALLFIAVFGFFVTIGVLIEIEGRRNHPTIMDKEIVYQDTVPHVVGIENKTPKEVLGEGVYDFIQRLRPEDRISYYILISDTGTNLIVEVHYEGDLTYIVEYNNGEFKVNNGSWEDNHEEENITY